jgi:hypothetical protein
MGIGGSSLNIPGGGSEGYHVLKVHDNSPGSYAGLEAFFDFIVAINGIRLVIGLEIFETVVHFRSGLLF